MSEKTFSKRLAITSIKERLVVAITGLVFCITLFQVLYFPARYRESAIQGLHGKAIAIVKLVAHSVAPSLDFDDLEHANDILTGASKDDDLTYVAVYKLDGTLFAAYDGRGIKAPARLHWDSDIHVEMHDALLVITTPLVSRGGTHGGLSAAFDTSRISGEASDNLMVTWILGGIILLIGISVAQRLGTLMRRRIDSLVKVAQEVAGGNLKQVQIDDSTRDEIGALATAFNDMLKSQQFLVRQISTTARQIKSTSNEILGGARQQEQGATEQSSAVEETRHTMDSLLQSGRQIGQSAQLVLQNAEKTQMNNQLIAERISALSAHIQRITEILEVIKDIANKSELLALNAALEGTKAGEAGRGFSLVASQMQRLAENVMGAVRDIKFLTGDVRESTNASVLATEDGTKLASDTTRSARQISLIIQQQQTGTEQVSKAMDDVSQIAQQTASASKQALRTTKELTELSEQLEALVNRFQLDALEAPAP